jgi:hypothetical protein
MIHIIKGEINFVELVINWRKMVLSMLFNNFHGEKTIG